MILFKSRKDKSFLLVLNIDVCVTGFTQLRTWALLYSQGGDGEIQMLQWWQGKNCSSPCIFSLKCMQSNRKKLFLTAIGQLKISFFESTNRKKPLLTAIGQLKISFFESTNRKKPLLTAIGQLNIFYFESTNRKKPLLTAIGLRRIHNFEFTNRKKLSFLILERFTDTFML